LATGEPELAGRVALVTGANTGIGRLTATRLAAHGAHVFVAGRSEERTSGVLDDIRALGRSPPAQFLPLDLGDFASVRACANAFLARNLPLHLLINNAGLAGARGLTKSGFEMAFGVNHVGHFLLTQLLLERVRASAPARIVTVASRAHRRVRGIDWADVRRPTSTLLGIREYCVSKLANALFSAELGRRLQSSGVTTYSLHPGVIDTDIWRHVPAPLCALNRWRLGPVGDGVKTTLHCALAASAASESGLYYSEARPTSPSEAAGNLALAAELWRRSAEWTC